MLNDRNFKKTINKFHDAGWEIVIPNLLVFLCLVMDAVFFSINSSMIKGKESYKCYHTHIMAVLRIVRGEGYQKKKLLDLTDEA